MTLCIASVCDDLTAIVTASDHMLTIEAGEPFAFETDEVMLKMGHLADGWQMMYSGNDISHVAPLMERIREGLQQSQGDVPHGFRTVAHVCKSVFREHWEQQIDDGLFSRYKTVLAKFLVARASFSPEERLFLFEKVAEFNIPLTFLVYGFGRDWSHIMTIRSPGIAEHYDSVGFWAIGGGTKNKLESFRRSQGISQCLKSSRRDY